jgi:hypothetical protein
MQNYLSQVEDDPTATLLGPGSYLAGFVFERAGEYDEALRFYDEALKNVQYASLADPVRHCAQYSSFKSPRLRDAMASAPPEKREEGSAEVLVVVSQGRVPALHAERVPIGLALTVGSLYLTGAQTQAARRLAGQGVATWVNFPELDKGPSGYATPSVEVDGKLLGVDGVTRVDDLVRAAFEKAKGPVMASAITRMLTRGAVGAAAGVGVGKSSNSGALGMLAAIATQAAMAAADTPDTRSWGTLPARVNIARIRLPPGSHKVRVVVQGVAREQQVELSKNGFAVVNVTELSQ